MAPRVTFGHATGTGVPEGPNVTIGQATGSNKSRDQIQAETLALIDDFALDCLLSDNHSFDSEVTEFPVESGSMISDNIRAKPIAITIEAIISNTPLSYAQSKRGDERPTDAAYNMLIGIRNKRRLVSITTSLNTYDNMALESFSIPRATGRGDELRFNATFKQVEIVVNRRSKRVAIPAATGDSSSSHSFMPVNVVGYRLVYVSLFYGTWYDDTIGAWRKTTKLLSTNTEQSVEFGPGGFFNPDLVDVTPVVVSKWLLTNDRPVEIPENVWANERIDQHTTALLRPRMLKIHGDKVRPMREGQPAGSLILLYPGQYTLRGVASAEGTGF